MNYEIANPQASQTTITIEFLDEGVGTAELTPIYLEDEKYLNLAGLDTVVENIKRLINNEVGSIETSLENINTGNGV